MASRLFCTCFCACLLPLRALATVSCISYAPWKVSRQGAIAFPRRGQCRLRVRRGSWMCSGPLCFLSSVCRGSLGVRVEIGMEGRGVPAWLAGEGWRGRGELLGNFALATLYPWGCVAPAPSSWKENSHSHFQLPTEILKATKTQKWVLFAGKPEARKKKSQFPLKKSRQILFALLCELFLFTWSVHPCDSQLIVIT